MNWTTLVSVADLAAALGRCVIVDCRHDLFDVEAGRRAWRESHLPGAHFLQMDEDLAGPKFAGSGRHPLPDPAALRAKLGRCGLGPDDPLVAYDASGGAAAVRLWWLARWLGHARVAVLDGGWPAWIAAGQPIDSVAPPEADAPPLPVRPSLAGTVGTAELLAGLGAGGRLIVDARSRERFRGDTEPLDPVAGHIPGAVSRPFAANLGPDGRFKPAVQLREEWLARLAGRPADEVVHSCGSGVTACHNLLAMEVAGLAGSALYPGSWSEWCADPARPVATGDEG
jgi:thiosulfate/3-mercaptopyruvate sulfurtransferase